VAGTSLRSHHDQPMIVGRNNDHHPRSRTVIYYIMSSNATDAEVFIYTGNDVPQDVVRVRVDPSVTSIPDQAFYERIMLAEVELCEGLVEIGEDAFGHCGHSITKINIPNSLRRIGNCAFHSSLRRCPIHLHDGIESIGEYAFARCIFTNFRVPPLITVILHGVLSICKSIFSVEISDNVTEIRDYAFYNCYCLRNVAFPPNAVIDNDILSKATDLLQLFGSIAEIIRNLKLRFDRLPIHSLVYYQSYNQGVLQSLIAAVNMRSGRFWVDPTGNQRDCLGMTPLHILTCSSVHDLELYRVIIDNYPANLIIEDRWGALPLLYAFWGGAQAEVIQFLLKSYQSLYSDHVFNWTMMVETMGRCDTPTERIDNLLHVQQTLFPEQPIDWEYLLDKFAEPSECSFPGRSFLERMRFLFMCGLSSRVEALAFKLWRDFVTNMICTSTFDMRQDNSVILHEIRCKLVHFDGKLLNLKEVTTILELALWKMNKNDHQDMATHDSNIQSQDRVTCGADVVIGHVLPFLINTN
jgi:hypothetical protein